MQDSFPCPACNANDWQSIGHRTYCAADQKRLPEYVQRRYRVLFDVWQPGQNQFVASFILCKRCGFVCYTPRPTENELQAKYEYLKRQQQDSKPPAHSPAERHRGQNIATAIQSYLHRGARVLDFGGGDGRLLAPLIDDGCRAYVIDYCDQPISGVERLGSTLQEVPEQTPFDAVICSHVIEHLADPFSTLCDLRRRVNEEGVVYIEVPMEIWRAIPAADEPVTHVNFFTRDSLRTLLERAGFHPIRCRHEAYRDPGGHAMTVVRAVARPAKAEQTIDLRGAEPTRRLLSPGLYERAHQAWIHPKQSIRKLTHFVRKSK